MYATMGTMTERWDRLAHTLLGAGSEPEAYEIMTDWAAKLAEDQEIADTLYRNGLRARMAGQLFVEDVELASRRNRARKLQAETAPNTFLNLPFAEAVSHFRNRQLVNSETFDRMSDEEKRNAFSAARAMSETIRDRMHADLLREIDEDPEGLEIFTERFAHDVTTPLVRDPDESDADWETRRTRNARSYLENVYRTATATSYAAGRYERQTDPEVVALTGYWEYLTIGDNRVRGSEPGDQWDHVQLERKQWRIGDPEGARAYPPNGYSCRCAVVVIDEEEVDPVQLSRPVDLARAIQPGFDGAPVGSIDV